VSALPTALVDALAALRGTLRRPKPPVQYCREALDRVEDQANDLAERVLAAESALAVAREENERLMRALVIVDQVLHCTELERAMEALPRSVFERLASASSLAHRGEPAALARGGKAGT
jgi:hypothetical protein